MNAKSAKQKYHTPKEPELIDVVDIDWHEFATLPPNPMQRDTEKHANKVRHILAQWHPRQRMVAFCVLPDGTRIKLDGHTRSLFWAHGMAAPPPLPLKAEVWLVADRKMAGDLKQTYDNVHAVNQAGGVLFGVLNFLGVRFESQLLAGGDFLGAMVTAQRFLAPSREPYVDTLLETTQSFLRELRMFDSIMPTRKRWTYPFVAVALLLLRRYGQDALPFLHAYQNDQGEKTGGSMNAQEAFNRRAEELRKDAANMYSTKRNGEIARVMVASYLAVEDERWFEIGQPGGTLRMLPEKRFQAWLQEARELSPGLR